MASGIKLNQECKETFVNLQKGALYRYAIMKIVDKKEITVEKRVERIAGVGETPESSEEIFDQMRKEIMDCSEPRYILFDITFTRKHGGKRSVPIYIYWCDDCVGITQKMIYAASNDNLKKEFAALKAFFECHDCDEFSYKEISDQLRKDDRL